MPQNAQIIPTSKLFLELLRERTATAHAELENLPVSSSLLRPDVTLASYQKYLVLMLDIWKSAELAVFPIARPHFKNFEIHKKSGLILNDLANTGYTSAHPKTGLFDSALQNPASYAIGIIYVLEGSTLGGRIIFKHIHEKINLDETNGARYFVGYGNKTGSMWKSFLADLQQYESNNGACNGIILGAIDAFEIIRNHLAGGSATL